MYSKLFHSCKTCKESFSIVIFAITPDWISYLPVSCSRGKLITVFEISGLVISVIVFELSFSNIPAILGSILPGLDDEKLVNTAILSCSSG